MDSVDRSGRPLCRPESDIMANRRSEKTTGPSQRQLRVGELIRHALAEMLTRGEIHDDVLAAHVVTIPEVRMSPDLRLATIYVMPLGGKDVKPVLAALERNKRYIRGEIAHAVNLKFAPDIRFLADETFDEADRIERLLASDKVRQDSRQGDRSMARRKKGRAVHGWLVLDKPAGMTSTQAVGAVRRLFDARKAGHAGTLDPLATGMLPIALGEATKTVPYAVDGEKGYRFTVRWGVETDTDDAEGRVVATSDAAPGRGGDRGAAAAASSARSCRRRRPSPPSRSTASAPTIWRAPARRSSWRRGRCASTRSTLVEMPDRRYRRVRGPLRQGHLRARAGPRHGPRARLPRPCRRAAPHARRALRGGAGGHPGALRGRGARQGEDAAARLLLPVEAALPTLPCSASARTMRRACCAARRC